MAVVLRTEGLTRRFGRILAVRDLHMEVHEGDMYGFLGLNGAGKTTTLRMILGLIRPTAGSVAVFGLDARRHFIDIMRRVGALVELPAYYPHLSAWKNLEIVRLATGGLPESAIADVLERVGLSDRMHDPVRTYSQGMRQRLGIAMALLPQPRLVILDEPTNGLDPQGVHHVRSLLLELNRTRGMTLVVSSHLLHEIELTCNRVGIIKQGQMVVQDTVQRILSQTSGLVHVRVDRQDDAAGFLRAQPGVALLAPSGDGPLKVQLDPARHADLNAALVREGFRVAEFAPQRMSLEDYFLSR